MHCHYYQYYYYCRISYPVKLFPINLNYILTWKALQPRPSRPIKARRQTPCFIFLFKVSPNYSKQLCEYKTMLRIKLSTMRSIQVLVMILQLCSMTVSIYQLQSVFNLSIFMMSSLFYIPLDVSARWAAFFILPNSCLWVVLGENNTHYNVKQEKCHVPLLTHTREILFSPQQQHCSISPTTYILMVPGTQILSQTHKR